LAGWICDVLDSRGDEKVIGEVREKVQAICTKHPVYEQTA
jgi:glycine hydroxymethyltransferase